MQPQPAFLLHKQPYRETSALVELLTLDHGRVRAVAQGVRRPGSRGRTRLQPYTPLHVTWIGDSDLKRLRMMESRGGGAMLAGEGLLCGFYANELLSRLLPLELPVRDVFAFYGAMLDGLPHPDGREPALRRLELALLEALDADPRFIDTEGRPLDAQTHYRYCPGSRSFEPTLDETVGLDGRTLRLLASGDWAAPGLALSAKRLTRTALSSLLGSKPLRSRELMLELAKRRQKRATD
ncbi:DNA repair protein RecO [Aidingimonas halophila]|uniref:DNA repair protein RecO n=1 Tax=Aidingimonas halophila TaxID=574349 RepID=A0A1H2QH80_9GAMM|nr:DNA repair protein RecO [Aidingimonas halophila]GHC20774.1 DNA repair protein RecO [Aidingimonas halophila]SDW06455.1 DNA replication and repair protein RecO [Aidingimonas halophila]